MVWVVGGLVVLVVALFAALIYVLKQFGPPLR